ncbi:MAG: PilZ domain-containing protein [Proteobacteria bacterium]|nr:PilZ domain-containing protein [Pseudomonadota bacterium]
MDKRREPRIEHKIRFFVHIHECNDNPDLVGVSIACEAVDFSSHGMQIRTDRELTPKTLLKITIGIGDPFAMYVLRGEIRWVKIVDDEYHMGVMLMEEEEGTDLDAWVEHFDALS